MRQGFGRVLGNVSAVLLIATISCGLVGQARAAPLVNRAEFEAWADKYYGQAVADHHAAGITVSVVQDGQLLFAKGYGYADLARGLPVSASESGFDVGSVSKTFIATAVAQLVDRGKIQSLDDPVNKYLRRAKLPGARGDRVTIRDLLTHRAGFEDTNFGRGAALRGGIPLTGNEIERFMPKLVLEPGGPTNYSNYGFSILGNLIEDVSGQRLDTFLKANIWDPLGMSHTSIVYGQFPANLAQNYQFTKDGSAVPDRHGMPHPWIAPAGGIVSTATDMALYMQAQMAEGEGPGPALMSKAMFRELHKVQHRNAPISIALANAFWVLDVNGAATLEHGGGTEAFQTEMLMIPEKRFGFFVSSLQGGLAPGEKYSAADMANGGPRVGAAPSGFALRNAFIARFLHPAPLASMGAPVPDLSKLVGVYRGERRPFTTLEVLGQAFNPGSVLRIDLSKDGRDLLFNGWGPYRDIGGGVFASPTGVDVFTDPVNIDRLKPDHIAFTFDPNGKVLYLTPGLADQAWVPVGPLGNPHTMLDAMIVFGAVVVSGLLLFLWPAGTRLLRIADYFAATAAVAVLALPVLMLVGFAKGDSLLNEWDYDEMGRFWGMAIAANTVAVLGLALTGFAVFAWTQPASLIGRKLHLSLVAASALGLIFVFQFFNLIGFHIPG